MNWDAIGAVGEIIGALAVVISVVYLAIQVRSGSAAVSTNLRDSVFASLNEWNYRLTADPPYAAMFHRGLKDFSLLTDEEIPRFMHTAYSFFKLFENVYLHYVEGSVGAEAWVQNREVLYTFSKTPGGKFYLEVRREIFDERFIKELEEVVNLKIRPTHDFVTSPSPDAVDPEA